MRSPAEVGPWVSVALVALGGAAGSAARAGLGLAMPGAPLVATLVVNVTGAFLLALVVERGRRQRRRLLAGTGFCGGFTTYSAVAVHVGELVQGAQPLMAAGYAMATLVAGALATLGGIAVGSAR